MGYEDYDKKFIKNINVHKGKIDSPKSIYLRYLKNQVLSKYHNLNSNCYSTTTKISFDKSLPNSEEQNEFLHFEYLLPGTDIRVKKALSIPSSLNSDLFGFSEQFRVMVKSCNWDEKTATNVLKGSMPVELFKFIENKENSEEILLELLKQKYLPKDAHYYNSKLLGLKQRDFSLITGYKNSIIEYLKRLSIC